MQKAADALIRRYLKGRFVGMDHVDYPTETPYIDHPPRDGGGELTLDPQLKDCIELVHEWPEAVNGLIREYWGEGKSQARIAYNYKIGIRKTRGIINTVRHKIIQKCIQPYTIN